jgi:hypothetical protein
MTVVVLARLELAILQQVQAGVVVIQVHQVVKGEMIVATDAVTASLMHFLNSLYFKNIKLCDEHKVILNF